MRNLHSKRVFAFVSLALFFFGGTALLQIDATPVINATACVYYPSEGTLVLKGNNFQAGASLSMSNAAGQIPYGRMKVKSARKIVITDIAPGDVRDGIDVKITVGAFSSELVHIVVQ